MITERISLILGWLVSVPMFGDVARRAIFRRWEHEGILERVQWRLDDDPNKMSLRCQTVEHPFGTIEAWMGATHFKMKTLKHVATEMALHVLAHNLKRVMAILGVPKLLGAL